MILGTMTRAAGAAALALMPAMATADGTLSASSAGPDANLAPLLEAERAALSAQSDRRLTRLADAPAEGPALSYSAEWLAARAAPDGGAEWRCLTKALYFEARGETVTGQFAVAEVIVNRVTSSRFPNSVCGVVDDGTETSGGCQFSFMCDGRAENMGNAGMRTRLGKIARLVLDGAVPDLTGGATYYHTSAVRPRWARVFQKTAVIGDHLFYRADAAAQDG